MPKKNLLAINFQLGHHVMYVMQLMMMKQESATINKCIVIYGQLWTLLLLED